MRFLLPQAHWLLLAVPVLIAIYLLLVRRRHKQALRYSGIDIVREAAGTRQHLRRHMPALLLLAAVAALLFSISRPTAMVIVPSLQRTIVLAIDVSVSMAAKDVDPDRLTAAQAAARKFVAQQPPGVRTGIVSFAGFAAVVQPPTQQRHQLLAAIDRLRLAPHTAIGSGLLVSLAQILPQVSLDIEPLINGPVQHWNRHRGAGGNQPGVDGKPLRAKGSKSAAVVLLSDGARTVGPDPIDAAETAAILGVPVHTVGIGSAEGAAVEIGGGRSIYVRMDEQTLKAIARITGGQYFQANTADELANVYRKLGAELGAQHDEIELTALVAAFAAILSLAAAGLSLLWSGALQ
jgi:Ca-activated chloride channel family protein